MEIQAEEIFEFMVRHLAKIPPNVARPALVSMRYAHMYLPDVVTNFWRARTSSIGITEVSDAQYALFYDAAWELARIGVLRPGRVAPRN